jgi:hypothetical protein
LFEEQSQEHNLTAVIAAVIVFILFEMFFIKSPFDKRGGENYKKIHCFRTSYLTQNYKQQKKLSLGESSNIVHENILSNSYRLIYKQPAL